MENSSENQKDCEDTDFEKLLTPFEYIRSLPGKHIRTKLAVAFNYWLNVENSVLEKVCEILDILHNASLL